MVISFNYSTASNIAFPACIINGTAVTRTFQILYRNEEVNLDDIVHFRIHGIVEGGKVGIQINLTQIGCQHKSTTDKLV